uniref:Putative protease n=1 Tax=viral metagenome TaxID=1070528 RepID=A0A6M3LBV5_9ZZZZ
MLYPRITSLNGEDVLVQDNQCLGYKEHMNTKHRIMFFSGAISGDMEPHNFLMTLDSLSHDPIRIVLTSPGGDLDSTFLFYDTMKMIQSPIEILGRYCASAGAILLAAGDRRYLLPHAKVMLHLPAGQMGGDAKDWDIQHKQMEKYRKTVVDILRDCGVKKSHDEILADIDRDYWMGAEEAIAYGLCDEVMSKDIWQSWIKED